MKYIPFSLKTRINRGSCYGKIYLCIKECLESKKNPQVMKFREKNLPFGHSYFFLNQSLKRLDYTISYNEFYEILLN